MTDPETEHTHRPSTRRQSMVLGLIASALLILSAATFFFGKADQSRILRDVESAQIEVVQEALDLIESEFRAIQESMVEEARSLAANPDLIRSLRVARAGDRTGEENIIRLMSSYELPVQGAIEIYDQQPRIIGWTGPTIPLDSAPSEANFLDSYQSSLAIDGDKHSALIIWWPIRDGIETVGAVRVMRMIVEHVPVRNEFLRDYTLDEEWTRLTTHPVTVELLPEPGFDPQVSRFERTLEGADGRVLLKVYVQPPSKERVVSDQWTRVLNVLFLWISVALIIVITLSSRYVIRSGRDKKSSAGIGLNLLLFGFLLTGVRFLLIALDVPSRWQIGKAPLSPLFDPQHLASGLGKGLMQTNGDLLLSAMGVVLFTVVLIRSTSFVRDRVLQNWTRIVDAETGDQKPESGQSRLFLAVFTHAALSLVFIAMLGVVAQRSVLDSTLEYFERSGLLPDQLVLIVFGALLLLTFSIIFVASRMIWVFLEWFLPQNTRQPGLRGILLIGGSAVVFAVLLVYSFTNISGFVGLSATIVFLVSVYGISYMSPMQALSQLEWLHLRSVVPSVVLISMLLYPVLQKAMTEDRRQQMEYAADSFEEEMDSRVVFAVRQLLNRVDEIGPLPTTADMVDSEPYDVAARALTHGELISSLGTHDISVVLFTANGEPIGRYQESPERGSRADLDRSDELDFQLLRTMYEDMERSGALVEKMTGERERERFVYVGFTPVGSLSEENGWLLVRAEPQEIVREGAQAFPRVLIPTGYYGDHYANMSLAEFQDGVMIRNYGRSFGRYNLDATIQDELRVESTLWKTETIRENSYVTLYRRLADTVASDGRPVLGSRGRTIAVRLREISFFDHLYYLLRITIAGLILGIPLYLVGIAWRVYKGLLPAPKIQFQNKVLNAFFAVGLITVTVTGWVGLKVVTGENERAIESWLRQHLLRVEDALSNDARSEELPYRVLERTDLDSLASRVGLDLNIYRTTELEGSSRPQLVRERLVDRRLPVQAYEALFFDGFRFASVNQSLGSFLYTAGYRALSDERGDIKYVISLPTLPEQERIEEERARTVAYLFGALLLLVLVVMVTASLLAKALARPIGKLRGGLEAVSAGRFESIGPVGSRDEIGDLVDSFNTMQGQLAESRDLLAKQERQLAWREMARQVAHEIKNPLTPMKLSIQHLRTAFSRMKPSIGDEKGDFEDKFNRTTTTLIEQIDALARIADGFSSFGRMPQHVKEPLDVNQVVLAAVDLMRNETDTTIKTNLTSESLRMSGDEEALRRLFINLIKNALQAIPDKQDGLIELSSNVVEENGRIEAEIMVSDNGSGIPEELWEKIFVPSFSTKTSGTGLGLAIAQKTVEDLDGSISFQTASGIGTSFRVLLPLPQD